MSACSGNSKRPGGVPFCRAVTWVRGRVRVRVGVRVSARVRARVRVRVRVRGQG